MHTQDGLAAAHQDIEHGLDPRKRCHAVQCAVTLALHGQQYGESLLYLALLGSFIPAHFPVICTVWRVLTCLG